MVEIQSVERQSQSPLVQLPPPQGSRQEVVEVDLFRIVYIHAIE